MHFDYVVVIFFLSSCQSLYCRLLIVVKLSINHHCAAVSLGLVSLPTIASHFSAQRQLNYDEVFAQSSPTNCTVYCGGILSNLSGACLATVG